MPKSATRTSTAARHGPPATATTAVCRYAQCSIVYICFVVVRRELSVERDGSDPGVVDGTTSPQVGSFRGVCVV